MEITHDELEAMSESEDYYRSIFEHELKMKKLFKELFRRCEAENKELKVENTELSETNKTKDKVIDSQQIELDLHANFKSVLRYCDERDLIRSVPERIAMGRALSKISRINGLEIHKVRADDPSGRYETVNCYVPKAFELFEAENPTLF
jgi:hypothetical protein